MPVFFDELAVGRFFRVVQRASVAFLPVLAHRSGIGGECTQLFPHAGQGRNGRPCQVEEQDCPKRGAAVAEGPQEQQGEEGVEDGGSLEKKLVVHDARPEEEAAGHSSQGDVVQRVFPARWEEQGSRQQNAQQERSQEACVFDGVRMNQHALPGIVVG